MESNAIEEATPPVTESLKGSPGPYAVQSVIAAVHCRALQAEDTDWQQIVRLYDALAQTQPSPIVSLNRAVCRKGSRRLPLASCYSRRSSPPDGYDGRGN